MKQIILFVLIFCCKVSGLLAQAPVLDSSWYPGPGNKYYLYRLNDQNPNTANDTGANVTWDFSDLSFYYLPDDSFDYDTPDDRNISCNNPQSTLISGGLKTHDCFITNSNGFYLAETNYASDSVDIIYSKPSLLIPSRLPFRQEIYDTSKEYYYYYEHGFPIETDSPYRGIMYSYRKYDGYGTLKLQGRQYNNAIRSNYSGQAYNNLYN